MEFSFADEPKKAGAPSTKMYTPPKQQGSGAAKRTRGADEDEPPLGARQGSRRRPVPTLSRIGIMFSGFLFAGMMIFTLSGYERISRAYADINVINSEMESARLRIKALDVQIECAVTILDAQETAERYGMQYPVQAQYVRAGAAIPIFGADNVGTTVTPGTAGTSDDTAVPDDGTPSDD